MPSSRRPAERRPCRMAPLARLPLFIDLDGARAVVAGGSDAAAWKAELLAASGAHVTVFAAELCSEMSALVAEGTAAGSLTLVARNWQPADLAGAAIAVADLAGGEGERFFAAARTIGVPVNVIDRPAFCSVEIGAIVNRSPVVVGISTAGAAPVLAQEIRARMEALLPAGLGGWARAARALRSTVGKRLRSGQPRRDFWRRFARRAFSEPAPAAPEQVLLGDLAEISSSGSVTLVGAGPGAADLLTLRAIRALQSADVILFDDLVGADVLELARREARRIAVGKRGGRESCAQGDITGLMVQLARAGNQVVRLKCGDPMIFGRGGEEVEALRAAGITHAVVPGISAANAAAASLGLSLTHRDHARTVTFMTGFPKEGAVPDTVDWSALAEPSGTLALYMGRPRRLSHCPPPAPRRPSCRHAGRGRRGRQPGG
ncbi:MAG: siroheme synthase CysG [Alphaproteobacteria bacterium]